MNRWSRALIMIAVSCLVVVACSDTTADSTTTSATALETVTTTFPAPVTTADEGLCPAAFCVTYHIRSEAIWSDGQPVTADDFIYTHQIMSDPDNGPVVTLGYDLVELAEVIDDKTVKFGFSEVYGAWRTLFGIVLPAHIGDPSDLSVTASAFRVHEQVEDDRILLLRNSNFWSSTDLASGRPVGDVDQVEFVFIESVRDRLSGLETAEFDVINPDPLAWVVADLREMSEAVAVVSAGSFWEHIDFNHDDPLLGQGWVREAMALAIDRENILDQTVRTVGGEVGTLDNSIWMTQAEAYASHYEVPFDPVRGEQILQDHFCVKGDDGIYSCQGRRMAFAWSTTVGDEFRAKTADLVQDSLLQIGIEVDVDFRTPSDLFAGDVLFGDPGVWQLINFSWKAAADPHLGNSTYYCTGNAPSGFGALNVNRYCNDQVEALIRSTDQIVEPSLRAETYNEADRLYMQDMAIIPLYQKPSLLAWNIGLTGPKPNMSRATDMWNLSAWAGKESIVVALETEPTDLDPVAPWNEDTALVMRSVLAGAFSTTPSLEFVPVLIESADIHVSER